MKLFLVILTALVAGGAVFYVQRAQSARRSSSWTTANVTRGDLLVTISASGTLEPEEVIDVGAQVAGLIVSFGTDADGHSVDYGSTVRAGTVLANIDDEIYAAQSAESAAQVQAAEASLQRGRADLANAQARLRQAERDWRRAEELGPSDALAESTYDGYRASFETAQAAVAIGEAAILQAEAGLMQARAANRRAERNLGYCVIASPVDGVVIDRRVNIGQTVVASLNAPSLFLIAKDLTRLQVWVPVNEADIGRLRPGQPVSFTVTAFPGETFRGEVAKIRLNASMTQNVVTYTVEVTVENPGARLLPYLTADVNFELDRRADVLQVPAAALRWTPSEAQVPPELRQARADSQDSGSPEASTAEATRAQVHDDADYGVVWVPDGPFVRPIFVRVGLSDDVRTEVSGEGLVEGLEVVTGEQEAPEQAPPTGTNPFLLKPPNRGKFGPPPPM